MLGDGGLALDSGHVMLNKSRLQNTVDAAALAAAKVLDQTEDEAQATRPRDACSRPNAAAATGAGTGTSGGDMDVTVEFSNTLNPFAPGTTPAYYVRVARTASRCRPASRRGRHHGEEHRARPPSRARAPTIMQACNIVPMVVCGRPRGRRRRYWGFTPGSRTS